MNQNALIDRWSTAAIEKAVTYLTGKEQAGPFGLVGDGRTDLRGLPLEMSLRPVGVTLDGLDMSYSTIKTLIFAESRIANVRLDHSHLVWDDFKSTFTNLSFAGCRMKGSGFGGRISEYVSCDFSGADLSGSSGSRANFTSCLFVGTILKNSVLGNLRFTRCKFSGKIEKVILSGGAGGGMYECDLTEAAFSDCGFNSMKFVGCQTGEDVIIFQHWPGALAQCRIVGESLQDSDIRASVLNWLKCAEQRSSFETSNLVDRKDLQTELGLDTGALLFGFFRQLSQEASHP